MSRVIALCATLILMCGLFLAQDKQHGNSQQDNSQSQQKQKNQQNTQQQQQPAATDPNKPKPLFGGTVNATSSSQKKDTTTLGFNGLDPQGKVEQALLDSHPTAADEKKVDQLAASKVNPAELKQFIHEGNLKEAPEKKQGGGQ